MKRYGSLWDKTLPLIGCIHWLHSLCLAYLLSLILFFLQFFLPVFCCFPQGLSGQAGHPQGILLPGCPVTGPLTSTETLQWWQQRRLVCLLGRLQLIICCWLFVLQSNLKTKLRHNIYTSEPLNIQLWLSSGVPAHPGVRGHGRTAENRHVAMDMGPSNVPSSCLCSRLPVPQRSLSDLLYSFCQQELRHFYRLPPSKNALVVFKTLSAI